MEGTNSEKGVLASGNDKRRFRQAFMTIFAYGNSTRGLTGIGQNCRKRGQQKL